MTRVAFFNAYRMTILEVSKTMDLEFRRKGLINQFTQMDEQTREKRVERNLEVDRQRIIRSDYFSEASTECIDLYTHGFFIATVMTTQAVNEGIFKFVAERNNIKHDNMNHSDLLKTLKDEGIITQDCYDASKQIRGSYRNDVHHMNPKVAEIKFPELAKKNIHNLAVIEREVWETNFDNGKVIPIQPKYWDINPDGTITVNLRGGF